MVPSILGILALGAGALAVPLQSDRVARGNQEAFDIQGHRGGRGETVESTLPSFAWGLINGVKTLELDNGITKDGVVVVWHDENIVPEKCRDTVPAFENDPDFPYVGKFIVNLTLAQVKTLDCGSERLLDFPLQTTYPKTPISTLEELFAFVDCVDPKHTVAFNIESKVNAIQTNQTRGPQDFVRLQHEQFVKSPFYKTITFQSFDWRSLVGMKALDPSIPTAALGSIDTVITADGSPSPWLAGVHIDPSSSKSIGVQLAEGAKSINADILSTADIANSSAPDPTLPGYVAFTTKEMVDRAHELGLEVKPWTVNRMNIVEQLLDWGVDGIITDYPHQLRRIVQQKGLPVAPEFSEKKVMRCLKKHLKMV